MNSSPYQQNPFDTELVGLLASEFLLVIRQQVCELFPGRSLRGVNHRLNRLRRQGYVSQRSFAALLSGAELPLYYAGPKAAEMLGLDEKDAKLLALRRRRAVKMSDVAIPHFLAVESVHIKFFTARDKYPDYELLAWVPAEDAMWRTLRDYGLGFVPDAYAKYALHGEVSHLFIEVDRSSYRGGLMRKMKSYDEYQRSSRFEQHFRAPAFRVLFVATNWRRAGELLRRAKEFSAGLFWVTAEDSFFREQLFDRHWGLKGLGSPQSLRELT